MTDDEEEANGCAILVGLFMVCVCVGYLAGTVWGFLLFGAALFFLGVRQSR